MISLQKVKFPDLIVCRKLSVNALAAVLTFFNDHRLRSVGETGKDHRGGRAYRLSMITGSVVSVKQLRKTGSVF